MSAIGIGLYNPPMQRTKGVTVLRRMDVRHYLRPRRTISMALGR